MKRVFFAAAIVLLLASSIHAEQKPSLDSRFKGTLWERIGTEKGLDPVLLYSVALIEARRLWEDGLVRPWPYAITENGPKVRSYYPKTLEEAKATLKQLLERTKNLDVGIMQVNLIYHGHRVGNPEDLLDMEKNVSVGADILNEAIVSATDAEVGVGRYHSWRPQRSRDYGRKVLILADALRGRI